MDIISNKRKSILDVLSYTSTFVLVLTLSVGFIFSYILSKRESERFIKDDLITRIGALKALTFQDETGEVEIDFAGELMPEYELLKDINEPYYFQIWHDDKTINERSDSLTDNDIPIAIHLDDIIRFKKSTLGERRILTARTTFIPRIIGKDGDEEYLNGHRVYLSVASGYEASKRFEIKHLRNVYLPLALLLVFSILLIRWILKKCLQPLSNLTNQLENISSIDNVKKIEIEKNATQELFLIQESSNNLLHKIMLSFEKEQSFSNNIAHELRTPISEIRTICEVEKSLNNKNKIISEIHLISLEMTELVETLLDIARPDAGTLHKITDECNVNQIIKKSITRFKDVSFEHKIIITTNFNSDLIILGNTTKLEIIFNNLIKNAIIHSKVGTKVQISSFNNKVFISNQAYNLNQDDIEKMFDRFWRGNYKGHSKESYGLGLPLVKSLCNYLNINIDTNIKNGVLTQRLEFNNLLA